MYISKNSSCKGKYMNEIEILVCGPLLNPSLPFQILCIHKSGILTPDGSEKVLHCTQKVG